VKAIAYLTSAYARASDSFIRAEVLRLRAAGLEVHTFSITEPPPAERVSEQIRAEHARTEYILKRGAGRLAAGALLEFVRSPSATVAALLLAMRCGWPGMKGRLWPLAYFIEACYLARRLREKRIEHLHNHIGEGSAVVAMLAAGLARIPYSLTIHGPSEFDRAPLLALREKVARSRFTAAISEFARSQLMRWTEPRDWERIHVVRCGVDAQEPPAPPVASRRLVSVGRLGPEKGHLVLVEAVARLKAEPHFEVVLVGDGPMRGRIENAARDCGVADRIRLAGWRAAAEVRTAILESRALVLPSFAEGLPVVLMEAFALGRPVIATSIAAIPELVEPGVSGWLVPAGSAVSLAEAMRAALAMEPARLARMGLAGRQRVRDRHDQGTEVGRLRALMQGAAHENPRAPGLAVEAPRS
jgi:glycosyltransferase involved in cell wall biosynthesis